MLIVCPHCSTKYDVSAGTLGDTGRTVCCARCRKTWFVPVAELVGAGADVAPAATIAAPAVPAEPRQPEPPAESSPTAGDDALKPDSDAAGLWGIPDFPAPPLSPATVEAVAEPPPGNDIESLAARRAGGVKARRRSGRLRVPTVPAIIAVELAAIIAIVAWRTEIVRAMPQTASLFRAAGMPVNLRGLVFTDVRTTADIQDAVTVLAVEGNIENTTRAAVGVPRLRFALRNAAEVEIISWTAQPDKGSLAPGETLAFHSRLASPPSGGHDVTVRFLGPRDLMSETR